MTPGEQAMVDSEKMIERQSLRRQVDLLHDIRDRVYREPREERQAWVEALWLLTDRVLHRLAALEGQPPYPHPADSEIWSIAADVERLMQTEATP